MIDLVRAILKGIFSSTFGSQAGNFGYPIAAGPSIATLVIAVALVAVVVAAVPFSRARVRSHEGLVVALWMVIGFVANLAFAQLAHARLDVVVESVAANAFYSVAQRHSANELLARFDELVNTFPLHARANLPGKTLLYQALLGVTTSTHGLAFLIILLSNFGGVLAYLVAKQWFEDSLTALYALVLYLFLPARIYFTPLLNTVSPLLLLLLFWFITRYLASRHPRDLILAGVALYAVMLFDPLALAALPVMASVVLKQVVDGKLSWAGLLAMTAWIAASFTLVYAVVRVAFGFDMISALIFCIRDAREFNLKSARPYSIWIVHNLKDFFINVGLPQTCVFLAFIWVSLRWLVTAPAGSWRRLDVILTLTFLAVLFGLDLAGVNRGESVRLWIFLAVVMQILVARALALWNERGLFLPVLAMSILQTALCVRIVAWIEA